ncbi:hypothetical protein UlMin_041256 [Ulmus minor]
MVDAKLVDVPLAAHFKLSSELCPKTEEDVQKMAKVPYASAVGSVMYAMVCTRPNIAHAVSLVSRYMANPGKAHWEVVKWLLRYLKGSLNCGLLYKRLDEPSYLVKGFVDADHAGDLDKRRSSRGYIFTVGGGCISWKSQLQTIVALSTTKSSTLMLLSASSKHFG